MEIIWILSLLVVLLPVKTLALMEGEVWSYHAYENEDVVLHCNDSEAMIVTGEVARWTIPSGKVLSEDHKDANYEVQNLHAIKGYTLKVLKVSESTNGVYVCTIYYMNTPRFAIIRGLNLGGSFQKDLRYRYMYNITVACVATAVFIVPVICLCLLYKFRYRTQEEKLFAEQYQNDPERSTWGMHATAASKVRAEDGAYDNPVVNDSTHL